MSSIAANVQARSIDWLEVVRNGWAVNLCYRNDWQNIELINKIFNKFYKRDKKQRAGMYNTVCKLNVYENVLGLW